MKVRSINNSYIFYDNDTRIAVRSNMGMVQNIYDAAVSEYLFYERMHKEARNKHDELFEKANALHIITQDECDAYRREHGRDAHWLDMTWSIESTQRQYRDLCMQASGALKVAIEAREQSEHWYQIMNQSKEVLSNAHRLVS